MNHFVKPLIVLLICGSSGLHGQINPDTLTVEPRIQRDTVIAFKSRLFAMSRYTGDSVILRWAPDQAGGWHVANQIGYRIERTEIGADSIYDPTRFEVMTREAIKPWPLDDWQKIAADGKDKYAAIAAQSLYGEGYQASGLLDRADEFRNRYSFALLAADFSPQTAEALGLRFVDRDVQPGRTYIYRIGLAGISNYYELDTAYVVVNTSEVDQLPEIQANKVLEDERKVSLYWDRSLYERHFSAYYIERSRDGNSYERLTENPYVNAISRDFPASERHIVFTDSLARNYEPCFYRIIGISPFGELSRPSAPLKAMGRDRTPPDPPINVKTTALSGTRVMITWQKDVVESDVAGYIVSRAQDFSGSFVPLFTQPLGKTVRSYTDNQAVEFGTNYYKVSVVDTAGNISSSLISYAMMIDSIPPSKPQNLTGTIDSTGIVHLQWSLGREKDLKGYNLYYSNSKDHVFTTLNYHPIQDTVYTDTIQVKTLTEEIFYFIKALDVNHSLSESSDTLRLIRPDLIAPTQPVITHYTVDREGILLQWNNSTSDDAITTLLYRKAAGQEFEELARFPLEDSIARFKDRDVEPNRRYTYALLTEDDAGLRSDLSFPITLKMGFKGWVDTIDDILIKKDEENNAIILSWTYEHTNVDHYAIYRAVDGRNFKAYKTVGADSNSFRDHFIKSDSFYEYALKVHLNDGRSSGFGRVVSLE